MWDKRFQQTAKMWYNVSVENQMKRKIYDKMLEWRTQYANNYALMLDGPRRVGKSWLAEEFAKAEYKAYVLIDFSKVKRDVKDLFLEYLDDLDTFFMLLETKLKVKLPQKESLIIFDEVQCFPRAREAIKHLVKDGRYHYLETGSLISIKQNVKDILIPSEEMHLNVRPMDFEEFLWATGNLTMMDTIRTFVEKRKPFGTSLHRQLAGVFRQYLVVGGMPQAILEYATSHDLDRVDRTKREILELYRQDIHKYGGRSRHKIEAIWDEIPAQLSRHEKRFKPGNVGENLRMRDLQESFEWLKEARTVNVSYNVADPNIGLKMTMDVFALKAFMGDTGLLISHAFDENELARGEIHRRILFDKIELNQGMLLENMTAQMIVASGRKPYFYSRIDHDNAENRMEIDFIISKTKTGRRKNIIPLEVKSGTRTTHISLNKFCGKFKNYTDSPTILESKDYKIDHGIPHFPIYCTPALLESV